MFGRRLCRRGRSWGEVPEGGRSPTPALFPPVQEAAAALAVEQDLAGAQLLDGLGPNGNPATAAPYGRAGHGGHAEPPAGLEDALVVGQGVAGDLAGQGRALGSDPL